MLQSHFQNGQHMVIIQGVKDIFTLPAEFDQMHLLQDAQLMGDVAMANIV